MKIPEILQIETPQVPGSLASVLNVIAEAGLVLEHVTTLRREQGRTLWEITLEIEEGAQEDLLRRLSSLPSARFVGSSDRVFERHRGGKIEMRSRIAISTQQILRDIYTPGVARAGLAIQKDPAKALEYTYLARCVAVITDGSAILGLGNISCARDSPCPYCSPARCVCARYDSATRCCSPQRARLPPQHRRGNSCPIRSMAPCTKKLRRRLPLRRMLADSPWLATGVRNSE